MKRDDQLELIALLIRQLLDAAALNHYYASLLKPLLASTARTARTWSELSEVERDAYTDAALQQAQKVFAEFGWGMDIQYLKELAQA